MNKINLTKYGFYRTPDKDFSDDGTRFTCYSLMGADRVRLSKAKWQDEVFLSATIYGNLDYDEYSNLPHYKSMDRLNGVNINSLTEDDIKQLAIDCLEYQQEYEAAEKNIVYPTKSELLYRLSTVKHLRETEYQEIVTLMKDNIDSIIMASKYDIQSIMDYTKSLKHESEIDVEGRASRALGKHDSRYIMKNQQDLKSSWYYRSVKEKIEQIVNKGLQSA